MGQREVYDLFQRIAKRDPEKWVTIKEVKTALKKKKCCKGTIRNVGANMWRMAMWGQLEVKGRGLLKYDIVFRLR